MPYAIMTSASTCVRAVAFVVALLVPGVTAARALEAGAEPSTANGLKLAQTLCANCHLIDGAPGSAVTAGIPTFSGIANKPGQTGAHIERILIAPHAPMPDMKLSYPEIQSLIGYIDSLRTDKTLPPLQPATKPADKPKYPTPS